MVMEMIYPCMPRYRRSRGRSGWQISGCGILNGGINIIGSDKYFLKHLIIMMLKIALPVSLEGKSYLRLRRQRQDILKLRYKTSLVKKFLELCFNLTNLLFTVYIKININFSILGIIN
jgi:hypothetical protein